MPGGVVSPGGASNFRFQYEHHGDRVLFWGWTGPNDVRVMRKDLTTIHIIERPSESFEVRDARWSHGGSVTVLGNNGPGGEDSLLLYKTPQFERDPTFVPREAIPLSTIDAACLLAYDRILAVAGRDVNGTSRMLFLETVDNSVRNEHEMFDNLTVQDIGNSGMFLHAIDVRGGSSIFNTSQWFFEERVGSGVGPCQFSVVRTNLPWTSGGVNGRLIVRKNLLLNQTVTFDVAIPPVQASTYIKNKVSSNVIVASPNGRGGSKIQVLHDYSGSFEVGPELDTDMTVTSMMLTPGETYQFGVGFASGAFKLYNVTEDVVVHTKDPKPGGDDNRLYKDLINMSIGVVILTVAVIVALWFLKVRTPKKRS